MSSTKTQPEKSEEKKPSFNVWEALRKRYENRFEQGGEWVYIREVARGTGYENRRHCDAIAINCYGSRGHEINGIEVKEHRSDWLRELKDAQKSDELMRMCDRWWLVVSDDKICKPEELPKGWGLLVPSGKDGLRAKVKAPLLKPKPVDRKFLCSLLRKVDDQSRAYYKNQLASTKRATELSAKYQEGYDDAKRHHKFELDNMQKSLDAHQKAIDDFEKKSGVRIHLYQSDHVGELFQIVSSLPQISHLIESVKNDRQRAKSIYKHLTQIVADIDRIQAGLGNHKTADVEVEVDLPLETQG